MFLIISSLHFFLSFILPSLLSLLPFLAIVSHFFFTFHGFSFCLAIVYSFSCFFALLHVLLLVLCLTTNYFVFQVSPCFCWFCPLRFILLLHVPSFLFHLVVAHSFLHVLSCCCSFAFHLAITCSLFYIFPYYYLFLFHGPLIITKISYFN